MLKGQSREVSQKMLNQFQTESIQPLPGVRSGNPFCK